MNDAGSTQVIPARTGQEDAIRTLVRRAYAMYVPRMGNRGYPEIRLYTHECMVENIAMYPRLGYEESHRVTEKGYARIYMRKKIG